MTRWRHLVALLMAGLVTLAGCGEQAASDPQGESEPPVAAPVVEPVEPEPEPEPEPPAEPLLGPEPEPVVRVVQPKPIDEGEWIGPINGLRFAVRPMGTTFDLDGSIPMLLLVHNATEKEISWPGFRPEPSVRREGVPDWRPAYDPEANLRVWIEPNRPDLHQNESYKRIDIEGYQNYRSPFKKLGPGQTSVTLFTIHTDHRKYIRHYHPKDSHHTSTGMVWYDNNVASGYTIKIRYQAGNFEPPEGKSRGATLFGWENVWVNFHPVEVTLMGSSRRR
ncbi:MAG: hypothetical protein AAF085_16205 [Planctomycetota bacterium]